VPYRVALVVPEFEVAGGVTGVGLFLRNVLRTTDRYEPDVISLARGAWDPASSQLTVPRTWLRGPQVDERMWSGIPYRHVGAQWSEVEFQRHRPRPVLTELLRPYDLVQVVAGTPPWAHVAKHVEAPVALQVATLTHVERDGKQGKGTVFRRLWHSWMSRIVSRMEDEVPSFVDALFVENTWMYEHLCSQAQESIVHFAPPGIDTSKFHPPEGEFRRGDYILSVGRFGDSRKNVPLLFEAYHRLKRCNMDVPRLVLAGLSGPPESAWDRAEALGIREDIGMHKNVPEEDLAELYRNARLFVLSSNEEGLGLVLAEAMASGTPVVSTDCGGPSTLIDDGTTGFLVPTGDAEALADRMAHVLAHPKVAKDLGRAGRERVETEFSVEAAGARFLEVYDELMADRSTTA